MSVFLTTVARWLLPLRRSWDNFAEKLHLRSLPAVPTICIVLTLAIFVPLQVRVTSREAADKAATIAGKQLHKFASGAPLPALGPEGEILSRRPAFHWPKAANAHEYRLTVTGRDGSVWLAKVATDANYFVQAAPSELEPGAYSFSAQALDMAGRVLKTHGASFRIRKDLAFDELRKHVWKLPAWEGALQIAGFHAKNGSAHDVFSALLAARAYAPEGASFEASLFAVEGSDDFAKWIKNRFATLVPAP